MIFIVTGGTKGLGRELTLALARKGHKVYSIYRNDHDSAGNLQLVCESRSLPVKIVPLDILDFEKVDVFCKELSSNISEPIGIIHAASVSFELAAAQKWSVSQFTELIQVNAVAFFSLAKGFFPLMKRNRGSLLVAISSQTIESEPSKGFFGYNVAKYALEATVRSFDSEWKAYGIKTISFLPTAMDSGIFQRWPDHVQKLVSPKGPLNTAFVAERISSYLLNSETIQSGERIVITE